MGYGKKCTCCETCNPQNKDFQNIVEKARGMAIIIAGLLLGASFLFIVLGIFERIFVIGGNTQGAVGLRPIVMVENIPNGTLLTILSLLIAFAGLLAWVFKEIIRKNLEEKISSTKNEIDVRVEDQRIASVIEGKLVTAYNLWSTHYALWKLGVLDGYSDVLNTSVVTGQAALNKSTELSNNEGHTRLIYICKNNLLFTLIHARWPSNDDRKKALVLSTEVYRFAEKQEKELTPILPPDRLKANRGLALIRFADNSEEEDDTKREKNRKEDDEKGRAIIKEILKSNTLEEALREEIEKNMDDVEAILKYIKDNPEPPKKYSSYHKKE